jgi:hypothetical protein
MPTTCMRPAYRPVPCSGVFRHWKASNHIAADVYQRTASTGCPPPREHSTVVPPEPPTSNPPANIAGFHAQAALHSTAAPGPLPNADLPREVAPVTPKENTSAVSPATVSVLPREPAHIIPPAGTCTAPLPFIDSTCFANIATPTPGAYNLVPLTIFQATLQDNDTLMQLAMLQAADRDQFIAAQTPEICGLEQQGVFTYHPIGNLPPQARLLNAIWSYCRKRLATGALSKYKSRLCTDGSQQRPGVDYTKTYAPVVAWSTVRLVLALSLMLNLRSRQVDFTQAFTQSPIDTDVFMRIPQGWYISNGKLQPHTEPRHRDTAHYIKLAKTLYGVKQAARQGYNHIKAGLLSMGFRASAIDPCLFIRHDMIILIYVDDCLLFGKTESIIDAVISKLSTTYTIGEQGSVQDFLGLRITSEPDGTTHFKQAGLICSILHDLHLTDSASKPSPAVHVLHPDSNGLPREELWNYRSIIGKLNFLAQMTRPDISMAVHNCARFASNPTSLHEQAVKRIGRYLAHTRNQGLIYRPNQSHRLDIYVDADFAGTWHREYAHLHGSCLSRSGFVLIYNGCPIHWGSKLQSEIALSTTEAEYIALSTATRELLPLRRILMELQHTQLLGTSSPLPPSTIYEDNASCLVLAHQETPLRPRTKHIGLKYHHFCDQITKGILRIEKVASASNWADIFTKPLAQYAHERLRCLMMGW